MMIVEFFINAVIWFFTFWLDLMIYGGFVVFCAVMCVILFMGVFIRRLKQNW
jgi:hypothetical protein